MTKLKSGIRNSAAQADAWEQRTLLVKKELAAESAANDAKTEKLRALRLEKERQDAEAAPAQEREQPAAAPARARMKRITVR